MVLGGRRRKEMGFFEQHAVRFVRELGKEWKKAARETERERRRAAKEEERKIAKAQKEGREIREAQTKINLNREIGTLSAYEFELFVAELFRKDGWEARVTRRSSDQGIDIIMRKGSSSAVVQCKKWKANVGEPVARDLYGTMLHMHASKGYIVITSEFTPRAAAWCDEKPIELIDRHRLLRWIEKNKNRESDVDEERFSSGARLEVESGRETSLSSSSLERGRFALAKFRELKQLIGHQRNAIGRQLPSSTSVCCEGIEEPVRFLRQSLEELEDVRSVLNDQLERLFSDKHQGNLRELRSGFESISQYLRTLLRLQSDVQWADPLEASTVQDRRTRLYKNTFSQLKWACATALDTYSDLIESVIRALEEALSSPEQYKEEGMPGVRVEVCADWSTFNEERDKLRILLNKAARIF